MNVKHRKKNLNVYPNAVKPTKPVKPYELIDVPAPYRIVENSCNGKLEFLVYYNNKHKETFTSYEEANKYVKSEIKWDRCRSALIVLWVIFMWYIFR